MRLLYHDIACEDCNGKKRVQCLDTISLSLDVVTFIRDLGQNNREITSVLPPQQKTCQSPRLPNPSHIPTDICHRCTKPQARNPAICRYTHLRQSAKKLHSGAGASSSADHLRYLSSTPSLVLQHIQPLPLCFLSHSKYRSNAQCFNGPGT